MVNEILFLRALGFLIIVPLGISPSKIGLRFVIAFLISTLNVSTPEQLSSDMWWLEIVIGVALGLPLAIACSALNSWGSLFDTMRGQTLGSIFDPLNQTSSPILALTCEKLCWILLLGCGAIEAGLKSIVESSITIPNSSSIDLFQLGSELVRILSLELGAVFSSLVPVGILFITIEAIGGIVGKLLPKASLLSEMFHIKTVLGFLVVIGVLSTNQIAELGISTMNNLKLTISENRHG